MVQMFQALFHFKSALAAYPDRLSQPFPFNDPQMLPGSMQSAGNSFVLFSYTSWQVGGIDLRLPSKAFHKI
jgi:hypothetical protein